MKEAYHTCPFKGMNAQTIETETLNTYKSYFKEQLIEKLAQNHIDVETFKQLSTETHCSSPTYLPNQVLLQS